MRGKTSADRTTQPESTANETIRISVADVRERRRRRRELLLAGALFLVVIVLAVVELRFLGADFNIFLALFNLNFIILLIVLLLVVRNGVKLLLERRRKVLGSRLRSRLVMAFILLSLVPSALMYLVSVQVVQASMDYWFKSQVERSIVYALDVGQAFHDAARSRLERVGKTTLDQLSARRLAPASPETTALLREKYAGHELVMLGLLDAKGEDLNWQWTPRFEHAWKEMKPQVDWQALHEGKSFWSMWWPGAGSDFIVGVLPVDQGRGGYLVLAERLGSELLYKLDQIGRGRDEYKRLMVFKQPLTLALFTLLGLLTLLIVFGAMWFGFRLSKELTAPIQALAEGTERIARGDLAVRLDDTSSDELGVLVRSFNRMAEDLEGMRAGLTEANLQLAQQYQEMERRGRYMEAVLDTIAAGVVSLDGEGCIGTVNKAAAAMLGVDGGELAGQRLDDLLPKPYLALFSEMREALSANPASLWSRQIDVPLRTQELKLFVNIVNLNPAQGPAAGLVAVLEDVTELEKMQRMAAWREVARRIAHEIKNPLTPIKLSAQRLERKFAAVVNDAAFTQCTGLIVGQVEHLQRMVSEFSAFAKLPELVLRHDTLAPLLEEVTALFQHSHSQIRFLLEFQTAVPSLRIDREALRRGLINILTNAVEALEGQHDGEVRITAVHDADAGLVRLEFRDNGPGLTPEERSRLFEPYFSRKKGGTGLGLTILKSIIADHGGYVRAASGPGQGTCLVIELPLA